MKIGMYFDIFSLPYSNWKDRLYVKFKQNGFECGDFGMAHTDTVLYTDDELAKKIILEQKALAQASGVEITQVHGPWRWPAQDATPEQRAERMEKMKKSIQLTALLGCKNWVIHPIMPFGWEDIGTGNEQATWDLNKEFMTELLEYAKKYDITICFENMPMLKFSMAKPEAVLKFVREMNDEHFKICLDTGHVNVFPELSVGDEVRRLGDQIRVMHIHDNKFSGDLHLPPLFGDMDWDDFTAALKSIGFNEVFSLETAPSTKLPEDLFEEFFALYAKLARRLADKV